jgi:hypothetical protein
MFLFALAAAAAPVHSVTGAFGYALGQEPTSKIAACRGETLGTSTIYLCPGEGAFSRVSLITHRNRVTHIQASRAYQRMPLDAALRSCRADLVPLKHMVRRQHPALIDLPTSDGNFWFSEAAMGKAAIGRSILGRCSETRTARDGNNITLWFTYQLATHEAVRLIELDKAAAGTK